MNPLKKLASQTAVYGVSSILGRAINFALIGLHTQIFESDQFGVVTLLYTYVAFLTILYTYGMETTFFRFASKTKDTKKVFNISLTSIFITSIIISTLLLINASNITTYLGNGVSEKLVITSVFILFFDTVVAIPFAKLRLENKASWFAAIRVIGVLVMVAFNVVTLYYLPKYVDDFVPKIEYIFWANLASSVLVFFLLFRNFLTFKPQWDWVVLKSMLIYSLPILLTGFAGILNEQLDKILLVDLLPIGFYEGKSNMDVLGIYGASFKLSIFMMLAIQAFRYAGEPFFFTNAEDKKAPKLFADVFYYFNIFSVLIFVGVSVNVDLIAEIFLRQEIYREALYVVPILLLAKLFFGWYVNLSIWFKLIDKTIYGTYFALAGAVITILGNIILVPILGYLGSAVTQVVCYLGMSFICYFYGRKYFPIPYPVITVFVYLFVGITFVYLCTFIDLGEGLVNHILRFTLSLFFAAALLIVEKKKMNKNGTNFDNL